MRSRRVPEVFGGVGFGAGMLPTPGVGVGFFRPTRTTDAQLDHFYITHLN